MFQTVFVDTILLCQSFSEVSLCKPEYFIREAPPPKKTKKKSSKLWTLAEKGGGQKVQHSHSI